MQDCKLICEPGLENKTRIKAWYCRYTWRQLLWILWQNPQEPEKLESIKSALSPEEPRCPPQSSPAIRICRNETNPIEQIQSWTRVTGQNTSFILSFFKNPACASAPNEEQRQNLHGLDCRDDVDAGSEFPFHDAPLGE